MYDLPTSIEINNHHFAITDKGDYRMVIDCFMALEDPEMDKTDRILTALVIFYEDVIDPGDVLKLFGEDHLEEACEKMFAFFNCNQPFSVGYKVDHKLVDWEQDEQLIVSAVNNVAGKEIRWEPYIHWWTFTGYYMAIGESVLATVVSIRDKIIKGKKLEKHEKEYRRDNPQYFTWNRQTAENQQVDDLVRNLWNSNSGK